MRVHLELGQPAVCGTSHAGLPFGEPGSLLRLAGLLAARGSEVTLRASAALPALPGVHQVGTWNLPATVDACICTGRRPPDLLAERWITTTGTGLFHESSRWDLAVTSSQRLAREVAARSPNLTIEVVFPAVGPPASDSITPRDRFLCTTPPGPGLYRLLLTWPRLWERFHVPLVLAGDVRGALLMAAGEPPTVGATWLTTLGPLLDQPGILLQRALGEQDARRLLSRSLLLFAPGDGPAPSGHDEAPAILAACAAGVVPVLEPIGDLVEEYGSCACLVDRAAAVDEADAWISAIEQALSERAERGEAARAFAASRSWEACADRWLAILKRTLASPPRHTQPGRQRWLVLAAGPADRGEVHPAALFLQEAHRRGHDLHVVTDDQAIADQLAGEWRIALFEEWSGLAPIAHLPDRLVLAGAARCIPFLVGPGAGLLEIPTASLELTGRHALNKLPCADRIDLAIPVTRPGGAELFVRLVEDLSKRPPPAEAPGYVELVP